MATYYYIFFGSNEEDNLNFKLGLNNDDSHFYEFYDSFMDGFDDDDNHKNIAILTVPEGVGIQKKQPYDFLKNDYVFYSINEYYCASQIYVHSICNFKEEFLKNDNLCLNEKKKSIATCHDKIEHFNHIMDYANFMDALTEREYCYAFKYMNRDMQTSENYLTAVSGDGDMLEYVKDEFKTRELCLAGVYQNGFALKWVPPHIQSFEIYLAAAHQNIHSVQIIEEVSIELCKEICKISRHWFKNIKNKTPEICLFAINECSGNLSDMMSENHQTLEIVLIAVKDNAEMLKYVLPRYQTFEVCMICLKQNIFLYNLIETPSLEISFETVKLSKFALKLVKNKTYELCLESVKYNGSSLKDVSEGFMNAELCKIAIAQDGMALQHVPKEFRNADLCKIAVAQNRKSVKYVPLAYQ